MRESRFTLPPGIKRTKQRERVLAALAEARAPVSAADIYAGLAAERFAASLSTVYRILELFVNRGVATKTALPDGGLAVYEYSRPGHRHYAVCMGCRKTVRVPGCPVGAFTSELEGGGFHVLGHKVEIYGYCKECSEKK